MLFQFKDANHHCPWWKPSRLIQMIQKRSRVTYNCSEFCQEPPESSGRWECAVIHSSVHENSYINKLQLILATFNLSSNTNLTLQFCFCSDSCLTCGRSCSKSNHHQDDSQKTHWRLTMSWCVIPNYLSVIIVSALNKTACYLMMFSLPGLVFHWPYLDNFDFSSFSFFLLLEEFW